MKVWIALLAIAPWTAFAKPPQTPSSPLPPPDLRCASAIVIDAADGIVLFDRKADEPRFPASTTKMLTTLILLERTLPDDVVVAPEGVDEVSGASMHLLPGERVSAHDLAYAIMLRSANDACMAAAVHVAGSVEAFVQIMNERARSIGCRFSHFVNPHGLHNPRHKTTARDLALIAREAMRLPELREIARTQRRWIKRSMNERDRLLVNRNRALRKDETTIGVKTGFTNPAGRCFVGAVARDGFEVITVVLGSPDWVKDHLALADWAFRHYERQTVARRGDRSGVVAVTGGRAEEVGAELAEDVVWIARKGSRSWVEFEASPIPAPIKAGQRLGVATVVGEDGRRREVDVLAANAVEASPKAWPWALLVGTIAAGVRVFSLRRGPGAGSRAKADRTDFSRRS